MIIIRLIQETLNKTQQDIANDLGVSRQTISMWYSGFKISKRNLEAINKKYNIPMYLLEKAQVSGAHFTSDEVNQVKNSLVQREYNNENISAFYKILNLVGKSIIKSTNYDDFINKLEFEKVELMDIADVDINEDKKYLFIVKTCKIELLEMLVKINSLGFNKTKHAYLIKNDSVDSIEVLVFGGK